MKTETQEYNVRRQPRQTLAWVMWGVLVLAYFFAYFHRLSLSVIMDYLMADLQIQGAALAGALAGSYAIIYMFMQVPAGMLVDSWGPRKTATTGMCIACIGSFFFALATSLSVAFLGRVLIGLGVSVIFICILKLMVNWFESSRLATMAGLTGMVGNLGVAVGTAPLALLVTRFGWRQTYLAFAVVSILITILLWLCVRDTPGESLRHNSAPPTFYHLPTGKATPTITISDLLQALKKVIRNSQNWFIFISSIGTYGILYSFTGAWSVTYLMQIYGLERNRASTFMLVFAIGHMLGIPLAGYISDRWGRRRQPMLIILTLYLITWTLFWAWNGGKPPLGALYPLFFCIGFTCCIAPIYIALAKEANDPKFSGIAVSFINVGPFAGMSLLQPLMGYVLELRHGGFVVGGIKTYTTDSYRLLFAVCVLTVLICFIFTLKIKETGGHGHQPDN